MGVIGFIFLFVKFLVGCLFFCGGKFKSACLRNVHRKLSNEGGVSGIGFRSGGAGGCFGVRFELVVGAVGFLGE